MCVYVCMYCVHTYTHIYPLTCELSGSVDVVYKVSPSMCSVPHLPPLSQVTQVLGVNVQIPEPGVVPCAHSSGAVDEVDLPLGRGSLF